jgi:hypothetical protein
MSRTEQQWHTQCVSECFVIVCVNLQKYMWELEEMRHVWQNALMKRVENVTVKLNVNVKHTNKIDDEENKRKLVPWQIIQYSPDKSQKCYDKTRINVNI